MTLTHTAKPTFFSLTSKWIKNKKNSKISLNGDAGAWAIKLFNCGN